MLYCTCPSEATAAKTAMTLHKLGIERVRPLRGGYDEWKRLGYPAWMRSQPVSSPSPSPSCKSRSRLTSHVPAVTNSVAMLVPIGDPIPLHGSGPTAAL